MNNLYGLAGKKGLVLTTAGKPKKLGLAVGDANHVKNEIKSAYMWGIGAGLFASLMLFYVLKKK